MRTRAHLEKGDEFLMDIMENQGTKFYEGFQIGRFKKFINEVYYDRSKMERLATFCDTSLPDYYWFEEKLYKDEKNRYLIVGTGQGLSVWGKKLPDSNDCEDWEFVSG